MSIIAASWATVRPGPMSELGQSRPGRGNSKSSHVRYAAEDGSRFSALAVTHRHGGLISYDGISCSPLFFGSRWVPHERERTQKIANYRRKKTRENKGVLLIQTAHNGLVAGSSPAGPTSLRSRSEQRLPRQSQRRRRAAQPARYGLASHATPLWLTAPDEAQCSQNAKID